MNNADIITLVDTYTDLAAKAKVATEAAAKARDALVGLGAGTYHGTLTKAVVSTSLPVRFDSQAFRDRHPSLWEEFQKAGDVVTSVRLHGR
jgi:hypothetical protein